MKNILLLLFFASTASAQSAGERMLADYLRQQTARIESSSLSGIHSLEDWKTKRETSRQQLLEMLGLMPLPEKSDLRVTVTGKLETEKFVVEKLHFQSVPGLYVTANLYVPKNRSGPAPTILYLCGHARVFKDGIAFGNKAGYQHHPAWFAEHGYVAMIIDSLDLGEIEGEHHGTSRRGWWWWAARGYTPAGVETWNGLRAIDYLVTRAEVDPQRIGVTGRSGGGAYTWFLAAVDDRPSVLVPVAGITDMRNHVVDGAIEGHCDCMYMCNTYAWDFATLAALVAPRPLLLANSDKDKIFPLDGVQRVHQQLKRIYQLYDAEDKLGLFISEGPHSDTQELQLASFRWMNRWLKKDIDPVADVALKRFSPEELKVFQSLPQDQINTRIHDTFVAAVREPRVPSNRKEWETWSADARATLREKIFRNWPPLPSGTASGATVMGTQRGVRMEWLEFQSDEAFRLRLLLMTGAGKQVDRLEAHVLNLNLPRDKSAIPLTEILGAISGEQPQKPRDPIKDRLDQGTAIAVIMPRGTGFTAWPAEKDLQIRRRFLLLGQSLETLQVWDVRAALAALRRRPDLSRLPVTLKASGGMGVVALLAAIFEPSVQQLLLDDPQKSLAEGSPLPNALRYFDLQQIAALALPRTIVLRGATPAAWGWTVQAARVAGGAISFK